MKLRKFARQFAAAAVAGAMTLSLCLPALAETWNISNGQGGFEEVYYVQVIGTASGREVRKFGKPSAPGAGSQIETVHNEGAEEETVLSGSGDPRVYLYGHNAPVSVTLDGLTTKLEIKSSSAACMSTAGDVTVDLRGDNTIQVTKEGAGIMLGGPLTISGSGMLHVGGPNGGIQVAKNTLTVAGGNLNVTNGGINAYGGTIQVSNGGSLNVASGNINANSGTVKVSNGYLNVATNDIQASGGTIQAAVP